MTREKHDEDDLRGVLWFGAVVLTTIASVILYNNFRTLYCMEVGGMKSTVYDVRRVGGRTHWRWMTGQAYSTTRQVTYTKGECDESRE